MDLARHDDHDRPHNFIIINACNGYNPCLPLFFSLQSPAHAYPVIRFFCQSEAVFFVRLVLFMFWWVMKKARVLFEVYGAKKKDVREHSCLYVVRCFRYFCLKGVWEERALEFVYFWQCGVFRVTSFSQAGRAPRLRDSS